MEDSMPVTIKGCILSAPKRVATIKFCGGIIMYIDDSMEFEMPTKEQRENLKKMLCIEVIPEEDND